MVVWDTIKNFKQYLYFGISVYVFFSSRGVSSARPSESMERLGELTLPERWTKGAVFKITLE